MNILNAISSYAIPIIFIAIISIAYYKNIAVYDVFIVGAKDGLLTILKIIPSLIGLMIAIGVFRASGILDLIISTILPITNSLKIPSEILPLAFLRPISGSASLAIVSDIIKNYGADSFVGRVASTMMGSTETIFYTLAVYFGAIGIKNIRYTLVVALLADV